MRKIGLRLESLAVESFHTTHPESAAGTVAGHQVETGWSYNTCGNSCLQTACTCWETCPASCLGTCHLSCNGTCVEASCAYTCIDSCGYCGPATAGTCLLPCAP